MSKRNIPMIFGPLLLATAIGLGEMGLPHGLKLLMLLGAIALELMGLSRQCREKK